MKPASAAALAQRFAIARWTAIGVLGIAASVGIAHALFTTPPAPSVEPRREPVLPAPALAPLRESSSGRSSAASAPRPAAPLRVNVNTASAAELELLPGIGPALAQRIIEERQRAAFTSIEDLDRVRGIGPRTLERLRPLIVVSE